MSPRKRAANRANAARSTGPRSDAGKARSSMNAVRHGLAARAALLPGEDPAELDALAGELEADLRPAGAAERELVGRVVSLSWRLRRVARAEEDMWDEADADRTRGYRVSAHLRTTYGFPQMPYDDDGPPAPVSGPTFLAKQFARSGTSALERMAVYEQRLDRALHTALRQLQQLRKLRAESPEEPPRDEPFQPGHPVRSAASPDADATVEEPAPAFVQNEPTAGAGVAPGDAGARPDDVAGAVSREHAVAQNEPTPGWKPGAESGAPIVRNEPTGPDDEGDRLGGDAGSAPSGFAALTPSGPACARDPSDAGV